MSGETWAMVLIAFFGVPFVLMLPLWMISDLVFGIEEAPWPLAFVFGTVAAIYVGNRRTG